MRRSPVRPRRAGRRHVDSDVRRRTRTCPFPLWGLIPRNRTGERNAARCRLGSGTVTSVRIEPRLYRRPDYRARYGQRWPYVLAVFSLLGLVRLVTAGEWGWITIFRLLATAYQVLFVSVVACFLAACIPARPRPVSDLSSSAADREAEDGSHTVQ